MKRVPKYLVIVAMLALVLALSAYDLIPLQDFCVAIKYGSVLIVSTLWIKFQASNTLGIALAHIDFAPYDLNSPCTHPCGTEILVVIKGTLRVGFVTPNADGNRLFTKVLNKGDVFVFSIGLIHF